MDEKTCDNSRISNDTVYFTALPYPLPREYQTKLFNISNNLRRARDKKRGISIHLAALLELELEMRNKIGIKHKRRLNT